MRAPLLLGLFLFLTAPLFASHVYTGYIDFERSANNRYVFTLVLYTDPFGIPAPSSPQTLTGPNANISLPFVASESGPVAISNTCPQLTAIRSVYRSSPIQLNGIPPASGWTFSFSSCCLGGQPLNIASGNANYLSITLFADQGSLPQISTAHTLMEHPVKNSVVGGPNHEYLGYTQLGSNTDSVVMDLAIPGNSSSQNYLYDTGYSRLAPLPDQSEDSANGSVRFERKSGLLEFDVDSLSNANSLFYYGVRYQYYRQGVIVAEKIVPIWHALRNPTTPQPSPLLILTRNGQSQSYRFGQQKYAVFLGDTLQLDLTASAMGSNAALQFDLRYSSFDSLAAQDTSLDYQAAVWSNLNAGGQVLANPNLARITWIPGADNLSRDGKTARLLIAYGDTSCANGRRGILPLILEILPPVSISGPALSGDTLVLCPGDSAGLTATSRTQAVSWSPAGWVSDSTAAQVMLSHGPTGWLYAGEPQQGGKDSVFVLSVPRDTFALYQAGQYLHIDDRYPTVQKVWYYNHQIPFLPIGADSVPLAVAGDYHVEGQTAEACQVSSDTFTLAPSAFLAASTPSGLGTVGLPWRNNGQWSMQFEVNQQGMLEAIDLQGLAPAGSFKRGSAREVSFRLYQDNNLYWQGTQVAGNQGFMRFSLWLPLEPGRDYRLAISCDTAAQFFTVENLTVPYNSGFLRVLDAQYSPSGQGWGNSINRFYALGFKLADDIGLRESASRESGIYPNPAQNRLHFAPLEQREEWQLLRPDGKLVATWKLQKGQSQIELADLPRGFYLLRRGAQTERLLLE